MTAPDRHVAAVIEKHRRRAEAGLHKYGVTLERTDLSERDWLLHLQEELMDAAVYAERLSSCGRCDERIHRMSELINARVRIEQELLAMAKLGQSASPEQLRDLAHRLGGVKKGAVV